MFIQTTCILFLFVRCSFALDDSNNNDKNLYGNKDVITTTIHFGTHMVQKTKWWKWKEKRPYKNRKKNIWKTNHTTAAKRRKKCHMKIVCLFPWRSRALTSATSVTKILSFPLKSSRNQKWMVICKNWHSHGIGHVSWKAPPKRLRWQKYRQKNDSSHSQRPTKMNMMHKNQDAKNHTKEKSTSFLGWRTKNKNIASVLK